MGATPEPWRTLTGEVKKLREQVRRLANASPFFGTGVHPNGDNGLDLDGTLNVDGEIVARGGVARSGNFAAGVAGWLLNASGDAEFNDLTLRGGIIGNDALTEPVKIVQAHDDADNFAVPSGAGAQVMSVTVPVPAGYSQALLMITASASATNTTAGADYLYTNRKITGYTIGGWQIGSATIPAGDTGVSYDATSINLTGLPSSLTITGWVSSAFNSWTATSTNVANLDAMVIFLR